MEDDDDEEGRVGSFSLTDLTLSDDDDPVVEISLAKQITPKKSKNRRSFGIKQWLPTFSQKGSHQKVEEDYSVRGGNSASKNFPKTRGTTKSTKQLTPKRSPHPTPGDQRLTESPDCGGSIRVQDPMFSDNDSSCDQRPAPVEIFQCPLQEKDQPPPSPIPLDSSISEATIDEAFVCSEPNEPTTMVEIAPDYLLPLVSAKNTASAVLKGGYCLHMCLSCEEPQYSLNSVELVICNYCRTIEPLATGEIGGGVGMGFGDDNLKAILDSNGNDV